MKKPHLFLFMLILVLAGCKKTGKEQEYIQASGNSYASKFSIEEEESFTRLKVFSPWQNADDATFEYLVGRDQKQIPDSLRNLTFIKSPVDNVIILSTTFISFIDTLGHLSSISAVSGGQYTYNSKLRSRIEAGEIADIGYDQNLNYERIVEINPDVVFMFGVQSGIMQTINKLEEFDIPVVIVADYLEPHPLGRSEWLKFFSVFYERQADAAEIFNGVKENYLTLVEENSKKTKRPSVMMGLPWKDTWYVAGGKSYAAKLIEDAGGDYIFKDIDNTEAVPYNIEAVFSKCLDADIWINPGVAVSPDMILEHDPRFEMLHPYKVKTIYSNAKRLSPDGGNDYWESGITHPDLILKDLTEIFASPSVQPKDLDYYFKLD